MKVLYLITALLLILCLAPMPYGFYQLVRFVAMIVFAVMAYVFWNREVKTWAVVFGSLALLFQPFAKIALGRVVWNIVDILVAIGLVYLFFYEKKYSSNKGLTTNKHS